MRNASKITLREDEKEYLETIVRSRATQMRIVQKARILLLKANGVSVNAIADEVGLCKKSVLTYLKKYKDGGARNVFHEAPGRGRNGGFSDEEKAWIINVVCQRPYNIGCPAEMWTYKRLTKYINEKAEEAGHARLSTISCSSIVNILRRAGIKPKMIKYPEHMHRQSPDGSNFYSCRRTGTGLTL